MLGWCHNKGGVMLGWCHNKAGLMQAGVITRVG